MGWHRDCNGTSSKRWSLNNEAVVAPFICFEWLGEYVCGLRRGLSCQGLFDVDTAKDPSFEIRRTRKEVLVGISELSLLKLKT